MLALSVLVMLVILATLILIYRKLLAVINQSSALQHVTLNLPFSLYTGWITVATIANISALQIANGWDDTGLSAVQWTFVKLALAGAIGATVVVRTRDIAFVLVVAWAAYGIYVKQSATPAVSGAALTLSLLALLLAANEGLTKLRRT